MTTVVRKTVKQATVAIGVTALALGLLAAAVGSVDARGMSHTYNRAVDATPVNVSVSSVDERLARSISLP